MSNGGVAHKISLDFKTRCNFFNFKFLLTTLVTSVQAEKSTKVNITRVSSQFFFVRQSMIVERLVSFHFLFAHFLLHS